MLDWGWGGRGWGRDSEDRDRLEQLPTRTERLVCGEDPPRTEASPHLGPSRLETGSEVTYLRLVSSACPWPARRFKRTVFGVSHLTCPLWLLRTRAQGCGGEGSLMGCVGDGTSQAS